MSQTFTIEQDKMDVLYFLPCYKWVMKYDHFSCSFELHLSEAGEHFSTQLQVTRARFHTTNQPPLHTLQMQGEETFTLAARMFMTELSTVLLDGYVHAYIKLVRRPTPDLSHSLASFFLCSGVRGEIL